jgi:hypothetical protein
LLSSAHFTPSRFSAYDKFSAGFSTPMIDDVMSARSRSFKVRISRLFSKFYQYNGGGDNLIGPEQFSGAADHWLQSNHQDCLSVGQKQLALIVRVQIFRKQSIEASTGPGRIWRLGLFNICCQLRKNQLKVLIMQTRSRVAE